MSKNEDQELDNKTTEQIGKVAVEAAEPELTETPEADISHWQKFRRWYKNTKKISIPLTILLIILILVAIPWTRYKIAGTVVKKDVTIRVVDSKTFAPVSEADVSLSSGAVAKTNGTGYAYFHNIKPGKLSAKVTKTYYKDASLNLTVGVIKNPKNLSLQMQATGRQVKINIANIITKKGLADVDVRMGDVDVKTDKSGSVTAVLPEGTTSQKAKLSLDTYNDSEVTVKVSDTEVKQNNFSLTPSGEVYFLSNRSGRVDVMKSNLDGSDAKIVLSGTGSEDTNNTVLMASPDWQYLALLACRDPAGAKLYIIDTSDDQLSTADEGSATFTIAGWRGDSLIYTVARSDLSPWKTGASKLKSYSADTGKLTLLDQTNGFGDSLSNGYEYYGLVFLSGNNVIYSKGWTGQNTAEADLNGKQNSLSIISSNGQDHKTIANYDANTKYVYYVPHGVDSLYIVENSKGQNDYKYYDYSVDLTPKTVQLNTDQLYKQYPIYYLSPDSKQALWSENRDGNTILVGNDSGNNSKTLISEKQFKPYGWFSNNYILLSKDSNELDIVSSSGGDPMKITNFLSGSSYGVSSAGNYNDFR